MNASPGRKPGWNCFMLRDIRSGPESRWMGMLSAIANSSSWAVMMQHEKSRTWFRITDRPVRIRVFDMLRTIAVQRLESTARSTGSNSGAAAASTAPSGDMELLLRGGGPARRLCRGDHDRAACTARRDRALLQHDART